MSRLSGRPQPYLPSTRQLASASTSLSAPWRLPTGAPSVTRERRGAQQKQQQQQQRQNKKKNVPRHGDEAADAFESKERKSCAVTFLEAALAAARLLCARSPAAPRLVVYTRDRTGGGSSNPPRLLAARSVGSVLPDMIYPKRFLLISDTSGADPGHRH
ncbi:hypothetical protein F2P81_003709 [Scophthalmus maximus]|uniref:Uncharacterized protein n=1 Tax=Scophthalmus maximus TaxID=52904 RepID=A0A6A4TP63_SCOMX|nr:hypothetical protein F2P81_003709 [Scophthalmus maximus]